MNDNRPISRHNNSSWNTFWDGATQNEAFSDLGVSHPIISQHWMDFFTETQPLHEHPRLIDLACGSGKLIEYCLESFDQSTIDITCADLSQSAIQSIQQRYPFITAKVADVSNIDFASSSFDIVTSQFGVEYAGFDGVKEAARLLAPGGNISLLIHYKDGVIYQECAENLLVITRVLDSHFIDLAQDMFNKGFAALGGSNRKPYDRAASELGHTLPIIENLLKKYGADVAGGTVHVLYNQVAKIHEKLTQFDQNEVVAWLTRMKSELQSFTQRMSAMQDSALDTKGCTQICELMRENNINLLKHGPLTSAGQNTPLAWVFNAVKNTD